MSHETPKLSNQPEQNEEDDRIRRWASQLVRPELVEETVKNIKKEIKEGSKKLTSKDITSWIDDRDNTRQLSKEEKEEIKKKLED